MTENLPIPSQEIPDHPRSPLTELDRPLPESGFWEGLVMTSGYILAISYPLLALSTGVRSLYQLFLKDGVTDFLPPAMSGMAALCYLMAAIGFGYRRLWAWRLSVFVLGFETLLTLVVGSLSVIYPDMIGRTVWRHFGADYAYFPLFQPLLGLVWLFWPGTLRAYGLKRPQQVT
jgi:hypothetical protein